MKLTNFIKLEKEFGDRSFETKYKSVDILLNVFSYLGNITSIFFAFFFLYQLLTRVTSDFTGKVAVFGIISVITLSIFELLKRFVLKGMCFSVIFNKKLNTEVIYNIIFSLILFCSSFYLTIHGAKIFSDNRDKVQVEIQSNMANNIDSITNIFNNKIEYKISERNGLIKNRDTYNEKIKFTQNSNKLKQYSNLINQTNNEIQRADKEIDRLRTEQSSNISLIKSDVKLNLQEKVNEIFKNQTYFIIISSFIELLILVGVGFHVIFKLNIYNEYKNNINNNQEYKLYQHYSAMLNILYQNGKIQYESELSSMASFINNVRNREKFTHRYIKNFISLVKDLGIIATDRQHKNIAAKNYTEAKEILLNFFNS